MSEKRKRGEIDKEGMIGTTCLYGVMFLSLVGIKACTEKVLSPVAQKVEVPALQVDTIADETRQDTSDLIAKDLSAQ